MSVVLRPYHSFVFTSKRERVVKLVVVRRLHPRHYERGQAEHRGFSVSVEPPARSTSISARP